MVEQPVIDAFTLADKLTDSGLGRLVAEAVTRALGEQLAAAWPQSPV